MSLSFLSPARTVLVISDEALFIYKVNGRNVKMMEAVPWSVEDFESNVSSIISKDCGGKPILILNDMVEQHYRKEKIPRVSVMDRQNVVKRKLEVAFPNYPVRAALPLKEKLTKIDKGLSGSLYIFAAVPASEAFEKTIAAAQQSLASIVGFYLLPIESSDMIQKLSKKISNKDSHSALWTIFMGQHSGGGLRQIVIRDGELALTRMTPISTDIERDPDLWAKDVYQEFQATMSYLSRFGFDSSDGLNVILVSEPEAGDRVSDMVQADCNFYSMNMSELTEHLNISVGVQDTTYHADPLHVAWIGRKSRFILPMKAKQIDQVSKPRQMVLLATVILLLGAAFQSYQMMDYFSKITSTRDDVGTIFNRKSQLQLQHDREVKRKEDLGYDIKLIQSSLSVHDALEKKKIELLPFLHNVGFSLGRDMRIDRLDLKRGRLSIAQQVVRSVSGGGTPMFVATMQLTFPSTTNAEKGNMEVQALRARLQARLSDHVVKITKLLEDYEYSEAIVVETGDAVNKSVAQDYVAEILIEGPLRE